MQEPSKQPRSWILLQIARGGERKAAAESENRRGRRPARPGAATGGTRSRRPPLALRLPQARAHPAPLRPRRQRGPTRSPTFPHFPAPPSPSAPPPPSSPNPATSAAAATHAARRGERPAGLRAHTHLLQPARPLPGPGARSAGPRAPGASDCAAPGLPGLQRNFPKALPPPQPGSGPTPLPLCKPAGRPGTRPGCARLGVPSPGRPEPHAPAPRTHAADTYG